jgi:hypothetical protein
LYRRRIEAAWLLLTLQHEEEMEREHHFVKPPGDGQGRAVRVRVVTQVPRPSRQRGLNGSDQQSQGEKAQGQEQKARYSN